VVPNKRWKRRTWNTEKEDHIYEEKKSRVLRIS